MNLQELRTKGVDKMIVTADGIKRNIENSVNKAQLAINDWQCSGEDDFLKQAAANLREALDWLKLKEGLLGGNRHGA